MIESRRSVPGEGVESGNGHPPGLPNRRVSAGQRKICKMRFTLVPAVIADEELSAPDGPIVAVPGSIHGDSDHRAFGAILRHTGGDVSVVVLYFHER